MEFRDLKAQYVYNKQLIDNAINKVITQADFISGDSVKELEDKLENFIGVRHCISCANGTDALLLALMVWGIKKGDAVFVPDFTFFSTAEVVALLGATPIFVDVEWDTYNISPMDLQYKIDKVLEEGQCVPKVIISVDLFGLPAEYSELVKLAKQYDMFLLEDGAQGFGGSVGTQKACSFGDISTTSFFPAKPLGCYGDGGAIFTDNDEWAEILESLRIHGKGKNKYDNVRIGMNSRLDTIQAALLVEKLEIFKTFELQKVNEAAKLYSSKLQQAVEVPIIKEGYYSSWAQYTIKTRSKQERELISTELFKNQIPCAIYYPKPLRKQEVFQCIHVSAEDNIITDRLCDRVLSLPLHPYLTEEDISLVSECICNTIK